MWQSMMSVLYKWKDSMMAFVVTDYEYDGADDFLII